MSFYDGSALVLLMIFTPEMAPRLIESPVSTIEVCPTLRELAGLDIEAFKPWTTGESLVYLGQGGTRVIPAAMEYAAEVSYAPMVSLRHEKWKFNRCTFDPDQLLIRS